MIPPATPDDEAGRLAALRSYGLLDTPPEPLFDDLVALASHVCRVPVSLISLVDAERQWFKARVGLDATATPRELSLCGHVVAGGETLVVEDATRDPRFADNPLVISEPRVIFYAGAPLITPDEHILGTLCVIDHTPRSLEPEAKRHLEALAQQAMSQIQLRAALARREALSRIKDDLI